MRATSLSLLLVVACGSSGTKVPQDAPIDVTFPDAAPLLPCASAPVSGTTITLRQLPKVADAAMLVTAPPGDPRLFVIERQGRIRILENEQLLPTPFLDISNDIVAGGEQGLLGLAFHPQYATNGTFYVFYTLDAANVLARYQVSTTDPNKANPTGEVLLSIPDYAANHNGGMIEFGLDGYLYIGTGDGGGGGDPCRNAQAIDRTASSCKNPPTSCTVASCEPLLGKILRIDVNSTTGSKPYGIPIDNPYAGGGGEPEIFIRGVRNPWRWSFDRLTGDLYIGDVGQDKYEELDVLMPGQQRGANLGWSMYEGTSQYNSPANPTGVFMPQFVRTQPNVGPSDGWEAIIGGQVYRGTCYPDIVGYHFFTDYSKHVGMRGRLMGGTYAADPIGTWPVAPASLHADARGELYLTTTAGEIYHIEAGP